MKMEGYLGICRACFEPVQEGQGEQVKPGGTWYHKECITRSGNSYYLALERIEGRHQAGEPPQLLLDDMERIFGIPALNDETYNEDNKEVIALYRAISAARG